jgi:hypothetical protein
VHTCRPNRHRRNRKGANRNRPWLCTPSTQSLLRRGRPPGTTSDLCATRSGRLTPSNDHHRSDPTSHRPIHHPTNNTACLSHRHGPPAPLHELRKPPLLRRHGHPTPWHELCAVRERSPTTALHASPSA